MSQPFTKVGQLSESNPAKVYGNPSGLAPLFRQVKDGEGYEKPKDSSKVVLRAEKATDVAGAAVAGFTPKTLDAGTLLSDAFFLFIFFPKKGMIMIAVGCNEKKWNLPSSSRMVCFPHALGHYPSNVFKCPAILGLFNILDLGQFFPCVFSVYIYYIIYVYFFSTWDLSPQFLACFFQEFLAGDGSVCDALEFVVLEMKKGEQCVLTAQGGLVEPQLGLGEGPVMLTLHLEDFEKAKDTWIAFERLVGGDVFFFLCFLEARWSVFS